MSYLIDPRRGDAEDDASSTKKRALLAIAGSMLVELSPAKFVVTWLLVVALPALTVGMIPPVASAWLMKVSDRALAVYGVGSIVILIALITAAWFGLRPLLRSAEASFWSLNSIAVQPCYALVREALRHAGERSIFAGASEASRAKSRAHTSLVAGLVCAAAGCALALVAWPHTKWTASLADLAAATQLLWHAAFNAIVIVSSYFSIASLTWGVSDALMDQPEQFNAFAAGAGADTRFRVAHLADLHIVAEPYGYRIESGRAGAQGNGRYATVLEDLNRIHADEAPDLILVTGDVTDAGRSGEWAAFLDEIERSPSLLERTLILPGNHDVNIVDRANPARLEVPSSPQKRLRQFRALSAMERLQGRRVHVFDRQKRCIGATLSEALAPHRAQIEALADRPSFLLSRRLGPVWADCFPLIRPPSAPGGLGVILLNSNSESNFSFTNALGLVTAEDARAVCDVLRQSPDARWIIGLHHHLVEYPMAVKSFSERIGTSLINGSWFVRLLQPFAHRIVLMHGHRHIDWIGQCGALKIVSAPSPVMEATNDKPTAYLVHTLVLERTGGLGLEKPARRILEAAGACARALAATAQAAKVAP